MEEECWVAGRDEEIVVHAADGEMPRRMHAGALQPQKERPVIGRMGNDVGDSLIVQISTAPERVDVASETARVVVQTAPIPYKPRQGTGRIHRAKVDGHVSKRTTLNAASSCSGRDIDGDVGSWKPVGKCVMRDGLTIPRKRVRGAVKERGAGWVFRVKRPVPVSDEDEPEKCYIEQSDAYGW